MATHSSVLAWRIPGMGEPGGLPSMGSHRVGHDWSDLAAAAAAAGFNRTWTENFQMFSWVEKRQTNQRSNCQHPLDHRKTKRIPENICFCFTSYGKTFECVDHNKLWKVLFFFFNFCFYFILLYNTVLVLPYIVVVDSCQCGKFLKRWEYQTTWPAFWEICAGQEATVRTEHGTTDWFKIGKGVR